MPLTIDEVDKISKLARLGFTPDEKQKLQHELSQILNYVEQVKNITSKSEVNLDEDPDSINLMRDDVAETMEEPEKFLSQAPAREGNYVKVKSVLE